ncbi:MAG: polysaccharide biosynthesis C-terminal domain-containing protein [Selenomonadaceae bacterium]|nr:polysaccharide biosynthesis C-terminal domain-containing protein [Selenomonadaceae bacterium]MBQ7629657.1 polysaccharide biosynthesis C-terminal domain-containing protein [Selenomonadaceae bacterium]
MKQTFISSYINRMLPSVIISQIVMTICTTIDAALTGQFLGAAAVAAEGMVTPVVMIVIAVAGIMSAGNATICSNESGKGNVDEINRVFSTTFAVSLSFSIVCTILILIFSSAICQGLGLTPNTELFNLTKDYMKGYVPLMPILSVIMTLPALLQIEGDNKTSVVAVSLIFILDIAFDLLNIFVIEGGVFGMALATTLSYYVAGVLVLIRFFVRKRTVKFSLKFVELRRVGKILSYGTPMFFNSLCMGLTTAALNAAFLHHGSEVYVAAYTIVSKIGDVLLCFCYGMGEMTVTVTGIVNGEEDRDGLKEILQVMFRKAIVINIALIAVTWIAAYWSVKTFTEDETIIEMATFGLKMFSLQFIFRSLIMCYVGYLRGLQKILASNIILAVMVASAAAFAWSAPLTFGVNSIWYSYVVSTIFSLIFIIALAGFLVKKNPLSWDNLILKSESYGIPKENFLEWQIPDIEKLCECCAIAADFIKSYGGTERQIYLLPLFMEELGKNVLTWAFRDGKEHKFTIKIMHGAEGFMLRFRDDGIHFDPAEYYKIHKGENPTENFGIRMVFNMNPEVTYLNTMNLNNLLVKLR